MRDLTQGRLRQQVSFLKRQILQEGLLPFMDVLPEKTIAPALDGIVSGWKDCIDTPLVTLWVILGQVISADHSCPAAVARLMVHRLSQGLCHCSSRAGAYCQARDRPPEKFFATVTCLVGRSLESGADPKWLWQGHRVYLFDGMTVSMPDTPRNQRSYPQVSQQKPGLGFPIARLGALTSLACGAIVNLGFCRYAGTGHGEVSLLCRMWDILRDGDMLLADRLQCNWTGIVMLQRRGLELVSRLNKANRRAGFRKGKRLGQEDRLVRWHKPSSIRALDWPTYKSLPETLTVREARIHVHTPGFRSKVIIVVTTLLDPEQTTEQDLAHLCRARWHNELDRRSIKSTMQIDVLRCKTPELVRKEVWTHILSYNLIRTIMAQAACRHDIESRTISFTAALQTLEAFGPLLAYQGHRVADRPGRFEPRCKGRKSKRYIELKMLRREAKAAMLKRLIRFQVPFVDFTEASNGSGPVVSDVFVRRGFWKALDHDAWDSL